MPTPATSTRPAAVHALPASTGHAPELIAWRGGAGGGRRLDPYRRLRLGARERPASDPSLAGGLRAWLEDAVGGALPPAARRDQVATDAGPCQIVVVRPGPHGLVVLSGSSPAPAHSAPVDPVAALRRALQGVSFRQLLAAGPSTRPFHDAVEGLGGGDEAGRRLAALLDDLDRPARSRLARAVRDDARSMAAQWEPPPPHWLPRIGARLSVPLAGGAVTLRAVADLSLGAPSSGHASVSLVALHPGASPAASRAVIEFLALVETVRSGAAPYRVATYDPIAGRLSAEDVTEEVLSRAVRAVATTLERMQVAGTGGR